MIVLIYLIRPWRFVFSILVAFSAAWLVSRHPLYSPLPLHVSQMGQSHQRKGAGVVATAGAEQSLAVISQFGVRDGGAVKEQAGCQLLVLAPLHTLLIHSRARGPCLGPGGRRVLLLGWLVGGVLFSLWLGVFSL